MKFTVKETRRRMAIHHEWKVAAMTGEGVVSFGFTIYRGKNKFDCQLCEIIKRVGISHPMELRLNFHAVFSVPNPET
jgi:hypothetical protein